jgi:hypothetical protein
VQTSEIQPIQRSALSVGRWVLLAAAASLLLLLAGCATPAGQGSRLLPWNWFHPDANKRLEKAEARSERAADSTVHAAHVETAKAGLALAGAGDAPAVQAARRFLGNANGLLAQVAPLTATEDAAARSIVAGLLSGSAEFIAKAEKAQAAAEKDNAQVSRELAAAGAALETATGKLAQANRENAESAAKYRRLWFWIYCIAGGWVALQALSGLARFYPGLAPVARLAGSLVAPAVQAAYTRATAGVSKAIADAEQAGNGAAETLRTYLDPRLDTAEQVVIAAPLRKL